MTRIDDIRSRVEAATKGPWLAVSSLIRVWDHDGKSPSICEMASGDNYVLETQRIDNRDFIAHAREDIPWLLERIGELRTTLRGIGLQGVGFTDEEVEDGDLLYAFRTMAEKARSALARLEEQ